MSNHKDTLHNIVETMTAHYVECMLWAGIDHNDDPLDANYGPDDLDSDTAADIWQTCQTFILDHGPDLNATGGTWEQHGHDLYLTRNSHGCGYWDRGYGTAGDILTAAAHKLGETFEYISNSGKVCSE